MKKPVTFRIDQDLIEKAKLFAKAENRTLTNFVETLLKDEVERRKQNSHTRKRPKVHTQFDFRG